MTRRSSGRRRPSRARKTSAAQAPSDQGPLFPAALQPTPARYDLLTYVYWLCWKYRCNEASGEEFQRLFEQVIKRVMPEFLAIRPYGSIGDRKSDGLFLKDGTLFQVYSPDELTQAKVIAKIKEDLPGAIRQWKGLRRWVFVYNVRRGLPPDVVGLLRDLQPKYPSIILEPLSSDALWELARNLPRQKLAEVLGPPPGIAPGFLLPSVMDPETLDRLRKGRYVIVQDVMSPINLQAVVDALQSEEAVGSPVLVRPIPEGEVWAVAAEYQKQIVSEAIERSRDLLPKFAVFSLAPIPLAVHLGFLLSDRVEVRLFQYDRDRMSWTWEPTAATDEDKTFSVTGLPDQLVPGQIDVVLRVSLSDFVSPRDTAAVVNNAPVEVDVSVPAPDVMWLRSSEQLIELGRRVRMVLKNLAQRVPECARIHLFYAGPTGGAITIGRAINPRMNPPVLLYEFSRQTAPRHRHVLTLSDEGR